MKLLKSLWQGRPGSTNAIKVRPASERPPPRARAGEDTTVIMQPKEKNPFLDDAAQKFELADDTLDSADPYQSHTWQMDPDSDTRKLKTIAIGKNSDKEPGSDFNPYDTGISRRGWKK